MGDVLDITPLRSLVAVADCGGFQRAADVLHLSQGAVSQHVRRLEAAVGRPLVERHGRGSRFTATGAQLLEDARRMLALHDETIERLSTRTRTDLTIGSTEHAAAQLLPGLTTALTSSAPGYRFRYRLDRGTRLRDGLAAGDLDLALVLSAPADHRATPVGELALTWFSAPAWHVPAPAQAVPLVAFDEPCALRRRALQTLSKAAVPAFIAAEAIQLAGVQAAVGAGLGVALLATLGQTPEGLVARSDLPEPEPLTLYMGARRGLPDSVLELAVDALRPLLDRSAAPAGPGVPA